MTITLQNHTDGWLLWAARTLPPGNYLQAYSQLTVDWTLLGCGIHTFTNCGIAYNGRTATSGAEFIVLDEENGISYFHLVNGSFEWGKSTYNSVCFDCAAPPKHLFQITGAWSGSLMQVGVQDGPPGSDTRPIDGAAIMPHSGYPVCAAFMLSETLAYAFAAGDAASLDLAACKTACGTDGLNLLIVDAINILIKVKELAP